MVDYQRWINYGGGKHDRSRDGNCSNRDFTFECGAGIHGAEVMTPKSKHTPAPIYECKGNHGFMCGCMQKDLDGAGWSKNTIENIVSSVNSKVDLLEVAKEMARCLKNGQLRFDGRWEVAIRKAEGGK